MAQDTSAGIWRDLLSTNDYVERFSGSVQEISTAVNDGFIKAQGVQDGTHSYGRVTDLILAHYYKEWQES